MTGQESSVQTDIFAMGCTLYRLLTGEYPFGTIAEIQAGVEPQDVHRLNPQIPLSLRNVVRRSLARDPADRYADSRRMNEDLGGCGIRNAWTRIADPATVETWRAETDDGAYELCVNQRARAGDFEVVMRRDQGSGLRQVHRTQHSTPARALQARRSLLVAVVEGNRGR